jgi:hypothetical protein
MRLFGAVVLIVGMVWLTVGCGGSMAPLTGMGRGGLTLTDSVSGAHYSLSVVEGAPVLTAIEGGAAVATDSGLVDSVTGAHYSVAVTGGALTLVPEASGSSGAAQIELADSLTAKTYALAVDSGALTLIPK